MKKPETKSLKITSLKEVLAIVESPIDCNFMLVGTVVTLKVRRAMSSLMEKRRELQRSAQPPYVKERNEYDELNAHYLAKKDLLTLQARAMTVYQCCPEVAALEPGLMDPAKILAFVTSKLPENIMQLIELTAIAGGVDMEVRERANFISAAPSES